MIRLFLDFDGTCAPADVGDEFFRRFGQFERHHTALLRGDYDVATYYRRSCASLSSACTSEAVDAFVASMELDPSYGALCLWAHDQHIPVTIVSDGFDRYIRPMIGRHGVPVTLVANTLHHDGDQWVPDFPGATDGCSCFCASCKRNVLLSHSGPDDVIVYVGDGRSDRCAVQYADIVFAKGHLAGWCSANGIPHHNVHTLFDVLHILRKRVAAGDLRPRKQAEIARRRAFEAE